VESEDRNNFNDSVTYKGFKLYSKGKLKYRPKAITDAIFITPNSLYSDNRSTLTSRFLSNLKVFDYPSIQYKVDPNDDNYLIANIYLSPRKKFTYNAAIDFTHSNIQDFGISGNTSVGVRNVFNGAETFEIGFRGNIGSSRQLDNPKNNFFNISEFGVDAKLNFPRIFFPFSTEKIIPKTMIPYTTFSVGLAKQTNIGLDKQNFTSSLSYNWTPKRGQNIRFDILNIQFVKNVNIRNYYSIYQSSYNALNNFAIAYNANPNYFDSNNKLIIDSGTIGFTNDVLGNNPTISPTAEDLKSIRSIEERRVRLTENNLIFATSINFFKTTNVSLKDNNFYSVRAKVESAGNLLSLFANASKSLKNKNQANSIFDVEYSQYFKTELEYIKHWDFKSQRIVAIRAFGGIAIPYGNSKSIPFSRSYFSGGSNDNRAWQPYSLGPGSSGGVNDFNEANLKLGFSAELRFNLFGKLNGAIFSDVGNIWNVLDNVNNQASTFNGFKSLKDIAVGTGVGLRYDFGLFVVRGDLGFKTYNPAKIQSERWFKELNFSKSVINIGINYPF
jgi:outer membrane protein assembly factor BamA